MSVYAKLQAARLQLVNSGIKKTGHNAHGGWKYYELGDFIPTIHKLFDAVGLCGVVRFGENATLTIYDTQGGESIEFSTPIVYAEAAKGQPIQLLGSTHTYIRRYLWLLAMEIVEADAIDSEEQEVKPVKIATKAKPPAKVEGKDGPWQLKITTDPEATEQDWINAVVQGTLLALGAATSEKDVMDIFKVNRSIYDKLKETNELEYTSVVGEFSAKSNSFKKEKA
jgi:hypothetical protein